MIPRPSLSLTFAAYAVWGLYAPSLSAAQPFLERYALASDRAAILRELIPGTDDYFFYSALFHQTQGDPQKAAALLKEWEEASSGPNGRRDILKNRAALLSYDKDPAGTLAWLKEKLSLEFNHQRETEEARAEIPSVLDPELISFAAFEQKALEGTEDLKNITEAGLYRLTQPVGKWKLTEIRALLSRLKRPDFPKLVDIIDRELREKNAAFGKFPIHTLLTSDQLAELQKRRPALLNNQTFTAAVMTRLRPLEFEDPDRDPAVRGAWLERLWAYAATLNPNANALKANLLYHLLAHDERQGKLDPQRLIAYLKLPRPVRYISAQYRKDHPDLWKFPAALDFDPSAFTGTMPVGDDEALVRRLLIRYLTTEKADAIALLVSAGFLNELLAEAKLTTGVPEPQKWMSLLAPESLQALRDRTDIEFDPASRPVWQPDDVVTLDVWLKNTPSLLVRVYEINTANVHRTGEEVNTGLDLDGLTANLEQKREFKDAPILRTKQTFSFPELNGKRGVWIIEFIGNGKASRALIRKGGLRTIVRQTSAGTAVTVLDEKLKPVPKAFAMIGPRQITGDEKGLILLPLSTQPGSQKVIIDDGTGFTALETIELQGEKYELAAGFHVSRESLLPGNKATLLIRPRLHSNGRPVLLESLEKAKVTIASETLDGTPASVVIPLDAMTVPLVNADGKEESVVLGLDKLREDKEITVEFAVPDRLKSLAFTLSGEVKSTLTGAPVQLTTAGTPPPQEAIAAGLNVHIKDSVEVNTTTTSGQVSDLHLTRNGSDWVLQCLGLNGEPRPAREVTVNFYRPEFLGEVEVLMKTDATGSIRLGPLSGLHAINATSEVFRPFDLQPEPAVLPRVIQINAGGTLAIPWQADEVVGGADIALFERRGDALARCLELPGKVTGGYIEWKALPPGTYSLFLRDNEVTVRVSPGEIIEGHAVTPASVVQLAGNRFLNVGVIKEADAALPDGKTEPALVFHIGNSSPWTRVHVFGSRFVTPSDRFEFLEASTLRTFYSAEPSALQSAWQPSLYLSTRNIGDEYRYVLERRNAARFAGNMLAKPGLLINPWEIGETETEKEKLEDLEKAAEAPLLPKPGDPMDAAPDPASATEGSYPVTPTTPPDPPSDLSFLATPAPVLLNLRPDKAGNVVIPRAALGDRQYIRVLAIDRESSAMRDFSLPSAALPPRDLRLARQFNPAQHFSRQNRVTVLEADAAFRFDDALAAQFQAIGHLGAVQQLFFNLTQNPQLNEFSWLLEWKTFDDAKKRALYSQYACHELNFFLQRKDRAFFDAVVQPFLASKRERTFMDDYLLGSDLTRYLAPWPYGRLNALERILLAERVKEEQPTARRMAEDWINMQPVNRGRDAFQFETALRGRALVVNQTGAEGRFAQNNRWDENRGTDWYFDTNGKADGRVPMNGGALWTSQAGAIRSYGRTASAADKRDTVDRMVIEDETVKLQGRELQSASENAEVRKFYKNALGYAELGQFNYAQTELGRLLAVEPNNQAARAALKQLEEHTADYLKSARDHTRMKMLKDVDQLWAVEVDSKAMLGDSEQTRGYMYGYNSISSGKRFGDNGLTALSADDHLDDTAQQAATGTVATGEAVQEFSLTATDTVLLGKFKNSAADGTFRLFRQQDPTKVWAEQQYYRLPLEAQTADLVPMNRFWRDYALWDGKGGFLSTNVADAANSFSEMMLALAVLDLPFPGEFKAGKVETKDNVLTLTPASRLLLFHQDILPAEADAAGAKLLVSQNFYREGDRYIEQAGEKTDKFVTAEFLTGAVYGCQVVVTNPSSSPARVDVLFQIPAGALPVKGTRRVQSLPVNIEPYRTQTLDFHFYFPQAGKFAHFPVHISRNDKTATSAAAFTFNVVARPTINDPASWDYVSQHGADNEVLSFLEQHNLYFLDMEKVLWRLQNPDFFKRVIAHLKERHHFDEGVWSYAALHNVQPYLQEYLQQSPLNIQCGPVFDAPVLSVNPVEQQMYQHLEYSPLINARAHRLGSAHRILNVKFGVQWESLMRVLAFRPQLSAEDWLAVASYLATQDRIEEALAAFAKVNRAAVAEKLQYEYLRAWLAMCQEDTATARRIAGALSTAEAGLPPHWKRPFALLMAQLDELDGKPSAGDPDDSREAMQNAAVDREPVLQLSVANRAVTVQFRHLGEVTVRYYPIDLEFLFSSSPFLNQAAERTAVIRPARSEKVMLPAGGDRHILALPAAFQNANVLVEVSGGGVTKATAVYAHALDVEIAESFGQLTVKHDGKALPRAYVKVYAQVEGEAAPRFYKDGYTDLRGKFDYASLSTDDLNRVTRFAILAMSEDAGSLVREVKPPAR